MPSTAVRSVLNDLTEAVSSSDHPAAKAAVDDLRAEYGYIDTSEQVLLRRAIIARDKRSLSRERRQTVDELARMSAAVKLPRAGIVTLGAYYVTAPSQVEDTQVIDAADSLAEAESTFVEAAEEASPVIEEVELPPTLALIDFNVPDDTQQKGSTFDIGGTIRDVGDLPTEDVSVSTTTDLPVEPSETTVGPLAVDAEATVTATVSAVTAGTFTIEFVATAPDAENTSRTVEVTVLDKTGYLDRILNDLESAEQSLAKSNIGQGMRNGIRAKLGAAIRKIEDAEAFVESGKTKQANNMLNAASNVLGAALNQLAADGDGKGRKNGNDGNDDELGLLVGAIESLIDEIADAKEAAL